MLESTSSSVIDVPCKSKAFIVFPPARLGDSVTLTQPRRYKYLSCCSFFTVGGRLTSFSHPDMFKKRSSDLSPIVDGTSCMDVLFRFSHLIFVPTCGNDVTLGQFARPRSLRNFKFLIQSGRFISFLQSERCISLRRVRRSIDGGTCWIDVLLSSSFSTVTEMNGNSSRLEHPSRCRDLRDFKLMLFGRFFRFLQLLNLKWTSLLSCLREEPGISTKLSQFESLRDSRLVAFERSGNSFRCLHLMRFRLRKFPRSCCTTIT